MAKQFFSYIMVRTS